MRTRHWFINRVEHPINLPRTLQGVGIILMGLASLVSVAIVHQAGNDRVAAEAKRADEVARQLATNQDVQACRSMLAADVTTATTDYLFAVGKDVAALGNLAVTLANRTSLVPALQQISDADQAVAAAAVKLTVTTNNRQAYEQEPNDKCKIPPLDSVQGAVPPIGISPPTSTTSTTLSTHSTAISGASRRGTTSTSGSSTTRPSTTTKPPTTTTTRPTPLLCTLLPGTLPYTGEQVPCVNP